MGDMDRDILEMFQEYVRVRNEMDCFSKEVKSLTSQKDIALADKDVITNERDKLIEEWREQRREDANLFLCAKNIISSMDAKSESVRATLAALRRAIEQIQEDNK